MARTVRRRKTASDDVMISDIVRAPNSGWSGSRSARIARAASTIGLASPSARTMSVNSLSGVCTYEKYATGRIDPSRLATCSSPTTPMISQSGRPAKKGNAIRWPIGRPSNSSRAKVSLTTSTGGLPGTSAGPKVRPASSGIPMTSK
jgi:hypothetical protein